MSLKSYTKDEDTDKFLNILCGKFSNFDQAQSNPRKYAHINAYFRRIKWELFESFAFYSEQSYDCDPWNPYRQALHKVSKSQGNYIIKNYMLLNSDELAGSGFSNSLLNKIKPSSIQQRTGCNMLFRQVGEDHYVGELESRKQCIIKRQDGSITYLVSHVDISKRFLITIDEGFDLISNRKVWGSESGRIKFKRVDE